MTQDGLHICCLLWILKELSSVYNAAYDKGPIADEGQTSSESFE